MRYVLLAACLLCLTTSTARAQFFIGGGESERGLRYGPYVPYDGMPYTQRYAYSAGQSYLYFSPHGGQADNLWYLDYLDRADRADKFCYRPPADPFEHCPPPVVVEQPVRWGMGLGWGLFRRH